MDIQKLKKSRENAIFSDEKILVVPREKILEQTSFYGFFPVNEFADYLKKIKEYRKFMWRSEMEKDVSYKQIIPYLIFKFENKFFIMQRKGSASESRLKNKYSLGIGGHIRQEDIVGDDIFRWAKREFIEEVNYDGEIAIKPIGLVNDDTNTVGQVHLGFVILVCGNSSKISVKSELKNGQLVTLQECQDYYENMESWSQFVFDYLKTV